MHKILETGKILGTCKTLLHQPKLGKECKSSSINLNWAKTGNQPKSGKECESSSINQNWAKSVNPPARSLIGLGFHKHYEVMWYQYQLQPKKTKNKTKQKGRCADFCHHSASIPVILIIPRLWY